MLANRLHNASACMSVSLPKIFYRPLSRKALTAAIVAAAIAVISPSIVEYANAALHAECRRRKLRSGNVPQQRE